VTFVDQEFELVEIASLKPHPQNPNVGDRDAIHESIAENGFYGAIVIQRSTGTVIAGWHRAMVLAEDFGETHVPSMVADVSDERALRMLAIDNEANRRGHYDMGKLADMLELLQPGGLKGSGFTNADLAEALRKSDRLGDRAGGFLDDDKAGQDNDPPPDDDEPPADDTGVWYTLTYVADVSQKTDIQKAIREAKTQLGDSRETPIKATEALAHICDVYLTGG